MKLSSYLLILLFLVAACGSENQPSSSNEAETPSSTSTDESTTVTDTSEESTSANAGSTESSDTVESEDDDETVEGGDDGTDDDETVEVEDDETNDDETIETELDDSDGCELELRAEVRDQSGPCTTCSFGDYITVVGIVENPCSIDLNYQATEDCVVSEFIIMNQESGSSSEYPMTCAGGSTVTLIPSGGELTKTRPAGRLSAANYYLTVSFKDPGDTIAELYFSVE